MQQCVPLGIVVYGNFLVKRELQTMVDMLEMPKDSASSNANLIPEQARNFALRSVVHDLGIKILGKKVDLAFFGTVAIVCASDVGKRLLFPDN